MAAGEDMKQHQRTQLDDILSRTSALCDRLANARQAATPGKDRARYRYPLEHIQKAEKSLQKAIDYDDRRKIRDRGNG